MNGSQPLFSFEGRIGRAPYSRFVLVVTVLFAVLSAFAGASPFSGVGLDGVPVSPPSAEVAGSNRAIAAKRWHDVDTSAWRILGRAAPGLRRSGRAGLQRLRRRHAGGEAFRRSVFRPEARVVSRRRSLRAGFAFFLAACAGAAAAGDTLALRGAVIAGGGGSSRSPQDCFALDGTVAEAAAGTSSAGEFALSAGFWGGAGRVRRDSVFRDLFEECR